jgi:hypothetical protein
LNGKALIEYMSILKQDKVKGERFETTGEICAPEEHQPEDISACTPRARTYIWLAQQSSARGIAVTVSRLVSGLKSPF